MATVASVECSIDYDQNAGCSRMIEKPPVGQIFRGGRPVQRQILASGVIITPKFRTQPKRMKRCSL